MTKFKDHFSKQSAVYRQYRPDHPVELIAYLASLCTQHELAWDCGTGNGQAAVKLADYFDKVIATDPSENQIHNAKHHARVEYAVQRAEDTTLATSSVDLLSVAVALHWFDFETFYRQAKRVLKPEGIIAAWTYIFPVIDPETDAIIKELHNRKLKEYWRKENVLVLEEYETIPFPFSLVDTPDFYFKKILTRGEFLGFLRSWSAVQRYIDTNRVDPLVDTAAALKMIWPEDEQKEAVWKVILKVGRM